MSRLTPDLQQLIEGTNGGAVEIIVNFPFMLRLVEAFLGLFSRIAQTVLSLPLVVQVDEVDGVAAALFGTANKPSRVCELWTIHLEKIAGGIAKVQ
jgi:hypothetical protein